MTEKVQKIKDWISKEQDGLMDAKGNFEYPEHEGAYHILCNLDAYIDSMQEEPKFKTGDRIKPIDSCLGSPRTIVDICDSWYVTDQGTLDFEYEDNWELAEEHKKCMYSKDNYTNEDRKALCDGCEEECEYAQNREPVSKDYRERYKNITQSDAFKSAYENKSLGEVMSVVGEEPISEDIEKEIDHAHKLFYEEVGWDSDEGARAYVADRFAYYFTKWQKEHLWKPADSDDLPEYEREVVVFTQNFPDDAGMMRVAIGHRPNPDGWDGKSLSTGKVEHYTPKTYDKGGWNIPDVVLWLDLDIPKIEED